MTSEQQRAIEQVEALQANGIEQDVVIVENRKYLVKDSAVGKMAIPMSKFTCDEDLKVPRNLTYMKLDRIWFLSWRELRMNYIKSY